jgi:hypothetical protein
MFTPDIYVCMYVRVCVRDGRANFTFAVKRKVDEDDFESSIKTHVKLLTEKLPENIGKSQLSTAPLPPAVIF